MDYLSSQLKGVTLNQLKICCDDEDQNALVAALSERLTATTSVLASPALQCGQIVVNTARSLGLPSVNLYPEHLKPKRARFNLTTMLASWLLAALVLGGCTDWRAGSKRSSLKSWPLHKRKHNNLSSS
nr:hypothetical protein [Vibrio navarrensis]